MNKLVSQLVASDSSIKLQRATLVGKQIEAAQVHLIQGLSSQKLKVEVELAQLLDLAPTSTTTLKVGHEQFSPGAFVGQIQEKKSRLAEIDEQLQIARSTLADWGGEEPCPFADAEALVLA